MTSVTIARYLTSLLGDTGGVIWQLYVENIHSGLFHIIAKYRKKSIVGWQTSLLLGVVAVLHASISGCQMGYHRCQKEGYLVSYMFRSEDIKVNKLINHTSTVWCCYDCLGWPYPIDYLLVSK